MSESMAVERYARALLLQAADDDKKAQEIQNFLNKMTELFKIPQSKAILLSPVMPLDLMRKLLLYAVSESVKKDAFYLNFIDLLLATKRARLIPEMSKVYATLYDKKRNILRVTLKTAVEVEKNFLKEIKDSLAKQWQATVDLTWAQDVALLGGFVIEAGHKRIDLSLRLRLEQLTRHQSVL